MIDGCHKVLQTAADERELKQLQAQQAELAEKQRAADEAAQAAAGASSAASKAAQAAQVVRGDAAADHSRRAEYGAAADGGGSSLRPQYGDEETGAADATEAAAPAPAAAAPAAATMPFPPKGLHWTIAGHADYGTAQGPIDQATATTYASQWDVFAGNHPQLMVFCEGLESWSLWSETRVALGL
eukprot:SAG22_NODE_2546_length_2458_cov_2.805002_2_plen_185_part_00